MTTLPQYKITFFFPSQDPRQPATRVELKSLVMIDRPLAITSITREERRVIKLLQDQYCPLVDPSAMDKVANKYSVRTNRYVGLDSEMFSLMRSVSQ